MTLEDLTDLTVGDGPLDLDLPKQRHDSETRFQSQNELAQYNPFITRPNMTWDDRTMDRMITIKKPKDIEPGVIWLTDGAFAETMSLLHISKSEQRVFMKQFQRIQALGSGELSRKIVAARQDRLMVMLLTQKSRPDVIEGGNMTERDSWVTSVQKYDQGMHYPPQVDRKKGFFGTILGR